MSSHLDAVTISNDTSWSWNVIPLLALAAVLCALFVSPGHDAEATAAEVEQAVPVATLPELSPDPEPSRRARALRPS